MRFADEDIVRVVTEISLPTVSAGVDLAVSVPGSEVVDHMAFESVDHPFTVTVLASS